MTSFTTREGAMLVELRSPPRACPYALIRIRRDG